MLIRTISAETISRVLIIAAKMLKKILFKGFSAAISWKLKVKINGAEAEILLLLILNMCQDPKNHILAISYLSLDPPCLILYMSTSSPLL